MILLDCFKHGKPRYPWKRLLKRAWRKYLLQEKIMLDIEMLHQGVYRTLKDAGACFSPDREWSRKDSKEASHGCHCDRWLTTPQGLALQVENS